MAGAVAAVVVEQPADEHDGADNEMTMMTIGPTGMMTIIATMTMGEQE